MKFTHFAAVVLVAFSTSGNAENSARGSTSGSSGPVEGNPKTKIQAANEARKNRAKARRAESYRHDAEYGQEAVRVEIPDRREYGHQHQPTNSGYYYDDEQSIGRKKSKPGSSGAAGGGIPPCAMMPGGCSDPNNWADEESRHGTRPDGYDYKETIDGGQWEYNIYTGNHPVSRAGGNNDEAEFTIGRKKPKKPKNPKTGNGGAGGNGNRACAGGGSIESHDFDNGPPNTGTVECESNDDCLSCCCVRHPNHLYQVCADVQRFPFVGNNCLAGNPLN